MQEIQIATPKMRLLGHISVILSMCFWATTYISSKLLLVAFSPTNILLIRAVLGFLMLSVLNPHRLQYTCRRDRFLVALAGFLGMFLYYYLDNVALVYTTATNVGVIVAAAPFFTMLASHIILKEEHLYPQYFIGFGIATIGIGLLTYGDNPDFALHPFGDLLALLAIVVWALYSVVTRILGKKGYPTLLLTKTMLFYALLGFVLASIIGRQTLDIHLVFQATYLKHFLFLGFVASALCFLFWNFALRTIGTIQSSFYLYLSPIITIIFATLFLGEKMSASAALGTGLTIGGLLVSEIRRKRN